MNAVPPPPVPPAADPDPDPMRLVRRVEAALAAGRVGEARLVLAALYCADPASPVLHALDAQVLLHEGRDAEALALLDRAVADAPADAVLRRARAGLRLRLRDLPGAVTDAAEAVVLDAGDPAGKALLGLALSGLGHFAEAGECLAEARRASPSDPAVTLGLARAREGAGRPELAEQVLAEGIRALPGHAELRTQAVRLRLRAGDAAGALASAEQARLAGAVDACGAGLRGHALSSLGRHDEAGAAYAEALLLAPDDPYVRHLVASAGAAPAGERAPGEYVRALFDGYADRFDMHLIHLGYRVPGLVEAALREHAPAGGGAVLDLGCGTGLLAVACMDLPLGPWVGVDLSERMLGAARAKGLYAELRRADLLDALADPAPRFPVVLAGDVLCYFGEIGPVLAGVRARLAPGGVFVASLERAGDDGAPRLGARGRYAHAPAYVRRAAAGAGLRVRELRHEALREEGGAPVDGMLIVLDAGA